MSALQLSSSPGQASVWLEPQYGPCALSCRFCPLSQVEERPQIVDAAAIDAVLAEVGPLLASTSAPVIHLEGADVLAFPRVVDLVQRLAAAGRATVIATPGTLLADPAFVARFVGLDVVFELPYHAVDPAVWKRITGSADHQAAVERAFANLAAAGLPFRVSMVVTRDNVDQIAAVARRLRETFGVHRLDLRVFNAHRDDMPEDFLAQGPDLRALNAQLSVIADASSSPLAIQVHDVPTCQIDPTLVGRLDLTVVGGPRNAGADCAHLTTCAEGPTCPGIAKAYPRRATLRPIDPLAALELRKALDLARGGPSVVHEEGSVDDAVAENPAAEWVVPVVDGGDAVLVIERVRPGAGYFAAGPAYGMYHHGDLPDAATEDKFGRLMRALRAAVDNTPPERLDLRALEYMASWVRRRMQDELPDAPAHEGGAAEAEVTAPVISTAPPVVPADTRPAAPAPASPSRLRTDSAWDAVVVGGGPAGAAAAAVLARAGRKVVLVERDPFPRYHIGESLLPHVWGPLERIGALDAVKAAGFQEKRGVRFVDVDGQASRPFWFTSHLDHPSAVTWQVERGTFDRILLDNAAAQGATVLRQTEAVGLLQDRGRVVGVRVKGAEGERKLRAPWTIDATGRDGFSRVARGWTHHEAALDRVSIWTWYKGVSLSDEERLATHVVRQPGGGWFWVIPMANGVVSIGVVGRKRDVFGATTELEAAWSAQVAQNPWVSSLVAGAERALELHATARYSYRSVFCADDGLVLVGDAFGFLDPVFSAGVFLALTTGELAARVLVENPDPTRTDPGLFAAYGAQVCAGVETMRALVHSFYDPRFHMGTFVRQHPELEGAVVDVLMGDLLRDHDPLLRALALDAALPGPLPHGQARKPVVSAIGRMPAGVTP